MKQDKNSVCCNHNCNQGRTCPVRLGTYKPAEAELAATQQGLEQDAARYRWLRATTNTVTNSAGERIDVRNQPEVWDKAIDDDIAAQATKQGDQSNGTH